MESREPGARDTDRPGTTDAGRGVLLLLALATSIAAVAPPGAAAQYFGRNKVQYDDFDFRVLETEHFRLHTYEGMEDQAVEDAARMAERWYGRLSRTFQHAFDEDVQKPLLFYANQPDFQQTNAIRGFISQGTGGVTEGIKNRVVMPYAETYGETDHVLGHELVHAFQYDLAGTYQGGGSTGFQSLPLWAVEGLAEYLTVGRASSHTSMWMRDAVLRDDLPSVEQLSGSPEYFPYRFGHALWAWIGGRFGDDTAVTFYRRAARWGIQRASEVVLGLPVDSLSAAWREDTRTHYAAAMEGRTRPAELGRRILPPGEDSTALAIAPAVSPNGRWVAYLGQRDIFSVDLYLADAETGEVQGRLATANADPHLDALAYMNTSGAWSPDAERFAFATYAEGDNRIAVVDVDDRSVQRRYDLADVGAVYSMDWSPDGGSLVFSGTRGGVTDLFLLDVEDGTVERLTDDRWSELHPAFSPDGTRIAFSTDRPSPGGEGSLERLAFPRPGLGILDRTSGDVRVRRPLGDAKHIDPEWSPGADALYFVSDPEGFADVHRLELSSGAVRQVTRVATGVSGVTDLSPALTVARETGDVLVSVFHDGEYMVRRLAQARPTGEEVAAGYGEDDSAGILPPLEVQAPARVVRYLRDPSGLPDPAAFQRHDYDSDLSLDYISQPSAGVAVDRFGTSLGGSVAAYFSDMLGNEQLGVGLQANGGLQDIGGQAVYTRLGDRTNWSVQAARIPYRTTSFRRGTAMVDGEEVRTRDLVLNRTIVNRGALGIQYPFSLNRRLEANAGATLLTFDREAIRTFVSDQGVPLGRDEVELDAPSSLTLYNGSLALVEDRSFMGLTSPVRGSRGRLEVEGNVGDLSFTNVLADYRRYVFMNPVTLAFRGFHLGRYGGDAESDRISPLFLGFERYVRGYASGSFDGADECTEVPGEPRACPELDRLIGSRMAVGNVELRVPLNGVEQLGLLDWGVIPVELSLFADAGVAWTSGDSPELTFTERSTDRIPVFSSGVSARFNVLGRLVVEAYWAYPFQRPDAGGQWGFQIAPGW